MGDDELERLIRKRKKKRNPLVVAGGFLLFVAGVTAMIAGLSGLFGGKRADSAVRCFPLSENGWTFECVVTGRGEAKADERFFGHQIDATAGRGGDPARTYRGRRWEAKVEIESGAAGGVSPGDRRTLYGTVVEIQGSVVRLTDCVFR